MRRIAMEAPTGRAKLAQGAVALGKTETPREKGPTGRASQTRTSDRQREV
jgi:hypothetical protein